MQTADGATQPSMRTVGRFFSKKNCLRLNPVSSFPSDPQEGGLPPLRTFICAREIVCRERSKGIPRKCHETDH